MSWDTAFEELMADGVSVKAVTGVSTDGYGEEVFGTASTYKARFKREQTLVRTFDGTEEIASSTVWVASTSTSGFDPYSQITVNGSTLGPLMRVEAVPDEDGVHHIRAFFG